jgi:hypothetical protein
MAWYKTGTVTVTNNSATVTGSGTNFVSGAQVGFGFQGPNGLVYEITAINSSTSLTITPVYGGSTASGQSYSIIPTQGLTAALASDVTDLITDYQTVADNAGAGKFGDGSAASPGIRFINDQDTGFFKDTANEIAVSVGGTKVGEFTSTGIDGTVIGGTTAAAGSFTAIESTDDATVNGVTVGRGAGNINTNTASGSQALNSNTTGGNNTAYGREALNSNTTGNQNTASGRQALLNSTTGIQSTAYGFQALRGNTTGGGNTANGYQAMYNNTTGDNNVAVGGGALRSNTIGSSNTALGESAEAVSATANNQIAIRAGNTKWYSAAGSPEGVVTAGVGSMYTNNTGGTGTTLYVKESGTGNTGWVSK